MARRRRRGPGPRSHGHRGRPRPARQAQADLRAAHRHRRPRHHHQRRQGRHDGRQGRAQRGLPPLAATRAASSPSRTPTCSPASPPRPCAQSIRGMLPKGPLGRQQLTKLRSTPAPSTRTPPRRPRRSRSEGPLNDRRTERRHTWNRTAHPDHRPPQARRRPCPAAPRHRPVHDQRQAARGRTSRPPPQRWSSSEPLRVAETRETYDVDASIHGGGVSGQAGALRMAIARSLVELDPETPCGTEEGRPPHA